MPKIIKFFKQRWLTFLPITLSLSVLFFGFLSLPLFQEMHCGEENCKDLLIKPLLGITLFFLPGAFSLLFVRKEVIMKWFFFALPYVVGSILFLANQEDGAGYFIISPRGAYVILLGSIFSGITILWAIIHSLIIRHFEKKKLKKS